MSALLVLAATATAAAAAAPSPPPAETELGWFFAAPEAHEWSLRFGFGAQFFESAAGTVAPATTFRLALHHNLGEWLSASAVADYSRLTQTSGALAAGNTQILLGAGFGFTHWVSRFRFDIGLEGGGLLRSASLTDGIETHDSFRADPALGVVFGAGIAIRSRALFGLQGSLRHQPGRTNFLLLLELDWLFGFE